jgi:outer membrane protein
MNKLKYLLAVTVVLFSRGYSYGQNTSVPQQLTDLIKKAFDNYPRLKQGGELIKLSETERDYARAGYMPTLDGVATYRYGKPTPELSLPLNGQELSITFFPANNYDFHVGLNLPIWDFGRTQASVKKTLTQIQTNKDNLESAKQMLAYQVAQIYYAIVFLNKSIDVQNDLIKLLQDNEKIISDRLKDGDALKFDLLSTQVKTNNAQNLLIDLQTSLKKQYEMLDMLTGMPGENYIAQKDVNDGEVSSVEVSSANNYNIIILNDQLKSSEWDITSAKRGWLPILNGQARIGYQNGYVPDVDKLELTYSAGVGLDIPIFSAARPNYQTKIAKINLQASKSNLETEKINLDNNILQTKSDIVATGTKLRNYEIQVDQAKEALNLANIRYRNGVITNLELLTSQTDLQNAELGRIQLEYNLLLSKLQLNQLGGTKFW